MEFNWKGLAELAWRSTQSFHPKLNGYWGWDKLNDVDKQLLDLRWEAVPATERLKYTKMVEAACHAYVAAVTV